MDATRTSKESFWLLVATLRKNEKRAVSPRQAITSSPYAIQTINAQQLGGLPASRYVATDANGNVGIGTTTPSQLLHLNSATSNAGALIQTPANAFAQYQLKKQ